MSGTEVLEFKLEIGTGSQGEYPVTAESPAGQAQETMRLPLDDLTFDNLAEEMQAAILHSGEAATEPRQSVQELGKWLFETTFTAQVRDLYSTSKQQAEEQGKLLRLRLSVKPPELAVLPWEYLYDSEKAQYICLSNTSLVRTLERPQASALPGIAPPLRVLGLIANSPGQLQETEQEKQILETATRYLQDQDLVELTWVEGQSWDDLQRAFRLGEWHIAHLVVPRGAGQSDGAGFITLVNEDGSNQQVSATQLDSLLTRHKATRLVVLCPGRGRGGHGSRFSAIATGLAQKSIPAVLAIEYATTEQATTEFLEALYKTLITKPVDLAVAQARNVSHAESAGSLEWGAANLYTHSPDMHLLDKEIVATAALQRGEEALDGDDFDRAITQFSLAVAMGAGATAQKRHARAKDVRLTLETARDTLKSPASNPEDQADAVIVVLGDLERVGRMLPDSRAIAVELDRMHKAAQVLRDKLWQTARQLVQAKSVGLTLDQRQRRKEEGVRLLEKAIKLDRDDLPELDQDLARAMRRMNYLKASRAQAEAERGRRWRLYAIVAAAIVAILLLLCFGLQQIPFTSLTTRGTAVPAFTQNPTGEPIAAQATVPAETTDSQAQPTPAPTEMPTLESPEPPTDVPTDVPTEVPASTPAPNHTPTPAPSDTATPAPTGTATVSQATPATLAPTATQQPSATPTLPPTEPATAQPEPASPTPAPTSLPTNTPTPGIVYPAPRLLAPEDISALSQNTFSTYLLKWEWDSSLQDNEWFDVRVWQEGTPHYGVSWTKDQEYLYDLCLQGNGIFYWSVAVVRGEEGQWLGDLSPEAAPHQFSSSRSDTWCRRHDRFHLPDRAGQQ